MSEAAPAAAPKSASKAKAKRPAKAKTPAAHPPTLQMVKAAIRASKDRKGTALPSIKKYIAANYKVDINRMAPFIRKAIKSACDKGSLVRVGNKGAGASGSFKLASKKDDVESKPAVKKPRSPKVKKPKSPAAKKPKAAAKKPAAKKPAAKPKSPKKPAAAAKPKSPKKTVKAKSPAKAKPAAKKPAAKRPAAKKAAK